MTTTSLLLEELAEKIETAVAANPGLATEVASAINAQMTGAFGMVTVVAADLSSIDFVLRLVETVTPGWFIRLKGRASEPDGHWTCALRQSEEIDEDEYLGYAKGPNLAHTLTAAVLRVLAYRRRHGK